MAEHVVLGRNCNLFYNTGTYESPTWTPITNVRDVTLTGKLGEADVSSRDSAAKMYEPTLEEIELTFEQTRIFENTIQAALFGAKLARTPIEFAVTESGTPATPSNIWFRSTMKCFDGPRQQPLEGASMVPWVWKPCWSTNTTGWTTNPGE